MIEKKTVVDQITIRRDGSLQLRLGLLLVEDGTELDCKWHRTTIQAGEDIEAHMTTLNTALEKLQKATVDAKGVNLLSAVAEAISP